jgi:uncharacterized protein YidB (DUF937 family)
MAKGMPSMMALLGLLAVAGYQNRDKLGDLFGGQGNPSTDPNLPNRQPGALGGVLGSLGGVLGGAAAGTTAGTLSGGLGELVDTFRQSGRGDKADSWVGAGANAAVAPADLEETLGNDTITELTQKTGLSRAELLDRLSQTLPAAVNHLTPDGRLPTQDEAQRLVS